MGGGKGVGWVWHLFKAGRLLTFSALRMGAYLNKYGNIVSYDMCSSKLSLNVICTLWQANYNQLI